MKEAKKVVEMASVTLEQITKDVERDIIGLDKITRTANARHKNIGNVVRAFKKLPEVLANMREHQEWFRQIDGAWCQLDQVDKDIFPQDIAEILENFGQARINLNFCISHPSTGGVAQLCAKVQDYYKVT